MDKDLEQVQIVFAQRLASGEPTIRKRALKQLQSHIKNESQTNSFTAESLAKLCKGLHYTLWMQDKMLLQEELAECICNLMSLFSKEEQLIEFVRAFILSLSKEWPFIDRWRMDKFLMLIRRLFRHIFYRLREHSWNEKLSDQYIGLFCDCIISSTSKICESLKFHCASVYLDELDNAGGLNQELVFKFIKPYANVLKDSISNSFFQSICTEIFGTILHDFSLQVSGEIDQKDMQGAIKFDFKKLAQLLFSVGSLAQVPSKRRKRIYALSKKFETASKGIDPFLVVEIPTKKSKRSKKP